MPLAQIDHPTMHKRHLEAEPLCMLEDQGAIEQLVLRHTSGAIVAAFSDEPSFLASIARESRSAFPVLVLQPPRVRLPPTRIAIALQLVACNQSWSLAWTGDRREHVGF